MRSCQRYIFLFCDDIFKRVLLGVHQRRIDVNGGRFGLSKAVQLYGEFDVNSLLEYFVYPPVVGGQVHFDLFNFMVTESVIADLGGQRSRLLVE